MQKTTLCALLASTLAAPLAHADNFTGFYAGAALGSVNADHTLSIPGTPIKQDLDSDSQTSFALLAGYGMTINQFYLGGELDWRNGLGESSATFLNGEISTETDGTLGLSVLPGYLISDNLLVFARLAYLEGDMDFEVTNTTNGMSATETDSGNYTGWGLGGQYFVNDNLAIRLEYREFESDTFEYFIDVPFEVESDAIDAFELGLVYQF